MWSRTCWGLRTTFFHSVDYIWLCCFLLTKAAPNALRQVLLCLWSTCTSPSFQNSSGIAEVLRELSLRILGMLMLQDFLLDFDTWPIALYTYIYIYWYVYIIYIYIFVCVNNIYIYIGSVLVLIPCLMHLCMCPVCPFICHWICQAFGQLSWQELCRVMEAHWGVAICSCQAFCLSNVIVTPVEASRLCSERVLSHDAQDHLSNVGRKLDCRRPVVKRQAETQNAQGTSFRTILPRNHYHSTHTYQCLFWPLHLHDVPWYMCFN